MVAPNLSDWSVPDSTDANTGRAVVVPDLDILLGFFSTVCLQTE